MPKSRADTLRDRLARRLIFDAIHDGIPVHRNSLWAPIKRAEERIAVQAAENKITGEISD